MARQTIENGLTMQEVTKRLNENFSELYTLAATIKSFNDIYPVGSIYISVNSTSPATLFGGTWEQIKDTFLLSAGDTYAAGSTGGEARHTLTTEQVPSLRITSDIYTEEKGFMGFQQGGNYGFYPASGFNMNGMSYQIKTEGGGQSHNNMPPYLTVYVWKRTA